MKKKRIIALLIDILIIILLTIASQAFINIGDAGLSSMFFSSFAVFLIICKDCYNGNSIGKYLMKIQIVDIKKSTPANPFKCAIRNYFYFIWIVEFIMFLCSKNGERLGDYLTKTRVVEHAENKNKINKLSFILTILFVGLIFISIYLYVYRSVSPAKSLFSLIVN